MADLVFNVAKGAFAGRVLADPTKLGVLLLKTAESDANLRDRATLTEVLAHNTEADFTSYARKTGVTGTRVVDQTNDVVVVAIPSQSWASAGGATNNTLAKAIVFYEDAAADGTRIPMVALDYVLTTDGTTIVLTVGASGIYQAA